MTMQKEEHNGFILPTLLFTTMFISFVILYAANLALSYSNIANREIYKVNAQMAADAGIDQALNLINTQGISALSGVELNEKELLNNGKIRTSFITSISNGLNESEKTLIVTGKTYAPANSSKPSSERRYKVDIKAVTSGNSPASVVSGVGGLILKNNSKITGGDVIVNGTITVNINAQIGLSTNPVNVRAAHQSCPISFSSEYPRVCLANENGQPITANGLIYGNVQAQNQINGANMLSPGLTSSYASVVAIPKYNRQSHKSSVTATYQSESNAIECERGSVSWPANIKIVGDLDLDNNCTVIINGNVWITGSLKLGNGAKIKVSDTLGSVRPTIMIDGPNGLIFTNNSLVQTNSVGTGVAFVTSWWNTNQNTNGGFTCGGISDPLDCTNVTGLALYTSQNVKTIEFSNNANAPGSIFESSWSKTLISNNGQLGAVSGQKVELGNNAIVNFTSSIPGSQNLIVTWTKRGYLRLY